MNGPEPEGYSYAEKVGLGGVIAWQLVRHKGRVTPELDRRIEAIKARAVEREQRKADEGR